METAWNLKNCNKLEVPNNFKLSKINDIRVIYDCMDTYRAEFKKLNVSFDDELPTKVAKGSGPSIYNKDVAIVATCDSSELTTVKNNFLIKKKIGLKDSAELDKGIGKVVETFGYSNKNKYKTMFYYLLTKEFSKESAC